MKRSARMLLMNSGRNEEHYRNRGGESRSYDRDRQQEYKPENRFRDRRGREHYDDGRYAPMNYYGDYDGGYPGTPYIPPVYNSGAYYSRNADAIQRPRNKIGFSIDGEMDRIPVDRSRGYLSGDMHNMSHSYEDGPIPFTREIAMEWTGDMENSDGSKGPHWSMEQVKQVMDQRGIDCDLLQFFAVLNSVYSDYCAVAKKHGVNKMDFYADLAKAWLDDPDAAEDKAARYFTYIAKR